MRAHAQTPVVDSFPRIATVNVTVTNMQLKPQKGEEVIFRGDRTGTVVKGYSNAAGKIRVLLPPGDDYQVSLTCISDTTRYAVVSVPALAGDQYFTDPWLVTIKFQLARTYRLDNVHFDIDKVTLRSDSYQQLTELFEYLERHSETKVEIAGHTDNVGKPADNLTLSNNRAKAVVEYLVSKNIAVSRLTAKGYGETKPIAENKTEEGRGQNRRTEMKVTGQ